MALIAAGAAFVLTSGSIYYYWGGEQPVNEKPADPEPKKVRFDLEHQKSDEVMASSGCVIHELKKIGRSKLKKTVRDSREPKAVGDLEKAMRKIRKHVKLPLNQ